MYLIFKISVLRVLPKCGKETFTGTYGCISQTSLSRRAHQQEARFSAGFFNFYRNYKHSLDCLHKRKLLSKCWSSSLPRHFTNKEMDHWKHLFSFVFPFAMASISVFIYILIHRHTV